MEPDSKVAQAAPDAFTDIRAERARQDPTARRRIWEWRSAMSLSSSARGYEMVRAMAVQYRDELAKRLADLASAGPLSRSVIDHVLDEAADVFRDAYEGTHRDLEKAERCVASIATMLGWVNVPPQETLERDINALRARQEAAEKESTLGWIRCPCGDRIPPGGRRGSHPRQRGARRRAGRRRMKCSRCHRDLVRAEMSIHGIGDAPEKVFRIADCGACGAKGLCLGCWEDCCRVDETTARTVVRRSA